MLSAQETVIWKLLVWFLTKFPSWRRNGFSPGSYELKRTLSDISNMQLSDQAFKSELFVDACAGCGVPGMHFCLAMGSWYL